MYTLIKRDVKAPRNSVQPSEIPTFSVSNQYNTVSIIIEMVVMLLE